MQNLIIFADSIDSSLVSTRKGHGAASGSGRPGLHIADTTEREEKEVMMGPGLNPLSLPEPRGRTAAIAPVSRDALLPARVGCSCTLPS